MMGEVCFEKTGIERFVVVVDFVFFVAGFDGRFPSYPVDHHLGGKMLMPRVDRSEGEAFEQPVYLGVFLMKLFEGNTHFMFPFNVIE